MNTANETIVNVNAQVEARVPEAGARSRALSTLSFRERLLLGIEIASYLENLPEGEEDLSVCLETIKKQFPVLCDSDEQRFEELFRAVADPDLWTKNNFFTAFLLYYVFTRGAYPQDSMTGAAEPVNGTVLGGIQAQADALSSAFSSAGDEALAEQIEDAARSFRRKVESAAIGRFADEEPCVGIVKIHEMFWDVFVAKYGNYSPKTWVNKLTEYRDKVFEIREECEFRLQRGGTEIYAVSYEGKLSKPTHFHCEDCSLVTFFDKNTWLAISADGVGSCLKSYFGSYYAVRALRKTIQKYLKRNRIIGRRRRRDENGNRQRHKPISDETWSKLMYYLRFELAKAFYAEWANEVRASEAFTSEESAQLDQFTSTLQFAFGCKGFIACGRVGDGSFFVRKKFETGGIEYYGGVRLNDGLSGVMDTVVLSIAHLESIPSAMLVDFYRPDEVTDIIITSDGADAVLGETVWQANAVARRLRQLSFEERCDTLSDMARACSDYNETRKGSGDDCTIVHIALKRN